MKQPRKTQYYKVQYYDPTSLTWIDEQIAYDTFAEAENAADKTRKYRFMQVDGKKRTPIWPV